MGRHCSTCALPGTPICVVAELRRGCRSSAGPPWARRTMLEAAATRVQHHVYSTCIQTRCSVVSQQVLWPLDQLNIPALRPTQPATQD